MLTHIEMQSYCCSTSAACLILWTLHTPHIQPGCPLTALSARLPLGTSAGLLICSLPLSFAAMVLLVVTVRPAPSESGLQCLQWWHRQCSTSPALLGPGLSQMALKTTSGASCYCLQTCKWDSLQKHLRCVWAAVQGLHTAAILWVQSCRAEAHACKGYRRVYRCAENTLPCLQSDQRPPLRHLTMLNAAAACHEAQLP